MIFIGIAAGQFGHQRAADHPETIGHLSHNGLGYFVLGFKEVFRYDFAVELFHPEV